MSSNFNTYSIPSDQTAEERDHIRRQYERETGRFNQPSAPTVTIGGRATEYVAGSGEAGGREGHARGHKTLTAFAQPGLRPGHVVVGGVETTIEAAKAAGIDIGPFDRAASLSSADEAAAKRAEARATSSKPQWGIVVEQGQQEQPQQVPAQRVTEAPQSAVDDGKQDDTGDTPEATYESCKAAVEAASKTIQGIEQLHGSHVVDAGLEAAADSGEMPDELPEGVTPGHIERIVAGYTASANSTLGEVGASVDMLMNTLSDDELREARRATVSGDSTKLQHLGARAVDMLASLPTTDPDAFAEMVEMMPPKERAALSRAANGDWIVTLPGKAPMGFGAAVRHCPRLAA
jgi:hypothetical protein